MKTRRFVLTLLPALLLGAAAGCREKQLDGPEGVKIGLALADGASPYQQAIHEAALSAAKQHKAELLVQDARGRASEQTRAIEQFLQQEASVIIVSPVDPEKLRPVIEKANQAKVYVVALEQTVPDADISAFIEFNQELAGQAAADYLGYRLKSGGKAAVIRDPAAPGEGERLKAFRAYLEKKHPSIQVVDQVDVRDATDGRAAAERLLRTRSNLNAIVALTDPLALAAAEAVRASGSSGADGCFVVGYGGAFGVMEELKKPDSPLAMVLGTFPQALGQRSERLAYHIVSNKQTPARVALPVLPVTRDNLARYAGWNGRIPRGQDLTIPWHPTDLSLETEKE
jgi:ABC-type sugar transport system substrate-binding protein